MCLLMNSLKKSHAVFPWLLLEHLSYIVRRLNPSTVPLATNLNLNNLCEESTCQTALTLLLLHVRRLMTSILMGCEFLRFFRIKLNLTSFALTPFSRRLSTAQQNPTLG